MKSLVNSVLFTNLLYKWNLARNLKDANSILEGPRESAKACEAQLMAGGTYIQWAAGLDMLQ